MPSFLLGVDQMDVLTGDPDQLSEREMAVDDSELTRVAGATEPDLAVLGQDREV
jgi:hypothetical protein